MSKNKKDRLLTDAIKYIWKFDKSFIFIEIAFGIALAVLPLINIFIPAKIIGIISTSKDTNSLIMYSLIAILGNFILLFLSKTLERIASKKTSLFILKERSILSEKVFKVAFPSLESARFEGDFNRYKISDGSPFIHLLWVILNISKGITALMLSIAMIFPFFSVVFKSSGTGFLHSAWYGVLLIGIILVVGIIVLLLSSHINKKRYKITKEFASYTRMFSFFQERLNDYNSGKDVRIFAQQDLIFDSAIGSIKSKGVVIYNNLLSMQAKQSGIVAVIGALVGFGIYSLIGLKGLAGFLSVESVVLCVGGIMQVVSGINNLGMVMGNISSINPRLRDFKEIMKENEEVDHGEKFNKTFDKLTVNNLSFKYKNDLPMVLENVSFEVKQGEKIAIVGQNGSGKSTFIKLLCGLYPPNEGGFLLDNKCVEGFNSKNWRNLFSIVFQDSTIFSLPLSQVVAGEENYDKNRLMSCLEKVGILEKVLKLPKGIDSYLFKHFDTDGIEISGGESQRIAMARALYKDAPIMILDEPTAALDPFAEQEIYNKFNDLTKEKTVFYISHRLSSCYFCDKIAVFDEGKLIQFGTHKELLKDKNGKYYILWFTQAAYYIK